jgi:hypothetical protein
MALPAQLYISLNFNSGATFGNPFTIGDPENGVLGVSELSDSTAPSLIIDLTDVTRGIKISRGRNIIRDTYETGNATVRIYDPTGRFNPQNTTSDLYGYLTPLRKLRISATHNSNNYYLFSGYTTDYVYSYDQAEQMAYVDINASDAFRLFNLAALTTVGSATDGQDTGTRIGKILDQVDFPNGMRTISTGNTLCQADPSTSRTALAAIKNVEFSEQGALYMSPAGNLIFKNRFETMQSAGDTPIAFNQTTGIPYKKLVFAFDDKLIVNQANVTIINGAVQTYNDIDSIATYFPHSITSTDLVAQTNAVAANIAALYVATRSTTTIRIDQMTIDLQDSDVPTGTILGMDYFTNVLINNLQPDGSTIEKNLQIQGVNWDISPSRFIANFTTLEPISDSFLIGNSTYGVLGDDILTY